MFEKLCDGERRGRGGEARRGEARRGEVRRCKRRLGEVRPIRRLYTRMFFDLIILIHS